MDALQLFAIACLASFIGSLQAGVVNTAVLAHTVKWGRTAGRRMAVGGAIPELIYAGVAFVLAGWLLEVLGIGAKGITVIVSTILLVLGIYFVFLFKPTMAVPGEDKFLGDMRRGMLLGFANPQLLLFWCGIKLLVVSFDLKGETVGDLLAFAVGAFVGALFMLLILVRLGIEAQARLSPKALGRAFRGVGLVVLLSGLYGMLRAQGWVP